MIAMENLKKKVVFITGASGGIGSVTAVEFAKLGCRLALTGRNKNELEEVKKRCQNAGQDSDMIFITTADLMFEEDIQRLVHEVVSYFGCIDVLVNNAACGSPGSIHDLRLEDMDTMYKVIVRGTVSLTQKVIPHLKLTQGVIVNVSSATATTPTKSMFGYCIMKAAIDHFTRCAAMDLVNFRIRVNAVKPGAIKTKILSKAGILKEEDEEDYYREMGERYPLGRVGMPIDVANVIVFLASDMSGFMTGNLVMVESGATHTVAVL